LSYTAENSNTFKPENQEIGHMASKKKAKKAKKAVKHAKKHPKTSKKLKPKKQAAKASKKPKKHIKHQKANKPKPKPKSRPKAKSQSFEGPVSRVSKSSEASKTQSKAGLDHYVNEIVQKIKNVEIQGANDIAEAGVRTLRHIAENSPATSRKVFLEELGEAADKLKESRPTEPALRNSINSIINSVENYELRSMENVRKHAIRQANNFLKELSEVVETISRIGAEEIRDGDIIVTHCHSEHVVAVLKKAKEKRKQFRVIVTETRPLKQGLITAKELSEAGIDTTYIIDAAVATVMKQATKMIVGADAILADGSIVNKIGTYAMALLAKQFQTPVFIVAETLKFDPLTVMGAAEPIEQRMPEEVADPQEMKRVHIQNPAYDVTPADLIAAMITEKGVMKPELIREHVDGVV
jgi:ribose 1,5-bisphosphate isomerase